MVALQKIALLVALAITLSNFTMQPAFAAAPQTYGDWQVGSQNDGAGLYAGTVNDSGLVLGEYCYFKSKTCSWLVGIDSTCTDGDKYPTLGNTDQGAASLVMLCGGKLEDTGKYVMLFSDWKSLEVLMQKSTRLGLAVPMQADQFKVWRFSLDGMTKAQSVMEAAFFSIVTPSKSPPKQNTSTSTL